MPESEERSIARDRRLRWLGTLLIAAVAIGLLAAWLSRGEFKGRYAIPELGADRNIASQPAPAQKAVPPLPKPAPAAPSLTDRPGPAAVADQIADQNEDDSARMARAIEKAARKALDRGEPVHWHKAGEEGYVVVSDARDFGDRVCRNVSATIDRDDGPAQSSSHLWCTTPDGDWQPAE